MTTTTTRINWDQMPAFTARARAVRSAELRRLARAAIAGLIQLARPRVGAEPCQIGDAHMNARAGSLDLTGSQNKPGLLGSL